MNDFVPLCPENPESYDRLRTLSGEFLRVFHTVNQQSYNVFVNHIFLIFLKKYYSGNGTLKKINEIKKNSQTQENIFASFLGVLGLHLIIRQGKTDKDLFIKSYINKLSTDQTFFENEAQKIFETFARYFGKLFSQEKNLHTLSGSIQTKIFSILSMNKIDMRSKNYEIAPFLEEKLYPHGVEDLATNGLLETSDSFLAGLKLASGTSQKVSLFDLFLLFHRRKNYTLEMTEYETLLSGLDSFQGISYNKKLFLINDHLLQSTTPPHADKRYIGKYGKELELCFLGDDGILDFARLADFISEYEILKRVDELRFMPHSAYETKTPAKSITIKKVLKHYLHPKYEALEKELDEKNYFIRHFHHQSDFEIECHLQKDVLVLINVGDVGLQAKLFSGALCIAQLEYGADLNLTSSSEAKGMKNLKNLLGFSVKNHPFFQKLTPEHQQIFLSRMAHGLMQLIIDVQKTSERLDLTLPLLLACFHTPFRLELEHYKDYVRRIIFPPKPIEELRDGDMFLNLLGNNAVKMKTTSYKFTPEELLTENHKSENIWQFNENYLSHLAISFATDPNNNIRDFLSVVKQKRAHDDFETQFLQNQKKIKYLTTIRSKENSKEDLLRYIYIHNDEMVALFGTNDESLNQLLSEIFGHNHQSGLTYNILALWLYEKFNIKEISEKKCLTNIKNLDSVTLIVTLVKSFSVINYGNYCLEVNVIKDLKDEKYKSLIGEKFIQVLGGMKEYFETNPSDEKDDFIRFIGVVSQVEYFKPDLDSVAFCSHYQTDEILELFVINKRMVFSPKLRDYFTQILTEKFQDFNKELGKLNVSLENLIEQRKKLQGQMKALKINESQSNAPGTLKIYTRLRRDEDVLRGEISQLRHIIIPLKRKHRLFRNFGEYNLEPIEKKLTTGILPLTQESVECDGSLEKLDSIIEKIEKMETLWSIIEKKEIPENMLTEAFVEKLPFMKCVPYFFYFDQHGYLKRYPQLEKRLLEKIARISRGRDYRRGFLETVYALLYTYGVLEELPLKTNPHIYNLIQEIFGETILTLKQHFLTRKIFTGEFT